MRAFWSQTRILPKCSAAILHGGFNTVLDALAAGVPIVAVPLAFEQPATAARLKRIGAARIVSPAEADKGASKRRCGSCYRIRRTATRQFARRRNGGGRGAAEAAALVDSALFSDADAMPAGLSPLDGVPACAA
ncbi:glycosyltransferase [Sphingomonas sp. 22L2VL55-3]